ncbi:MAG: M48 family metallopeptidase [Saprospiraceae bacterium]|nr:M48 family metallopeptidase [Saprospiraceae bacterium]
MKYKATIQSGGLEIPVEIFLERRRDTRFGLTGKRATLRVPYGVQADFIRGQLAKLEVWIGQVFVEKPAMRKPFEHKTYQTGDQLTVGQRRYWLDVNIETRATHTARLIGDTIYLQLSGHSSPVHLQKSIKTLLSRVVAGDFYPEIHRRVLDWNDRTFRQHIKSVNLKYNHSNWGSCSSHNNVNLSTRLLFAPDPVQDYVMLHELAHLVELNHSDRFWSLVSYYMPDYQDKEKWLKHNRSLCDF